MVINRRSMLGFSSISAITALSTGFGPSAIAKTASPRTPANHIRSTYNRVTEAAGGKWWSYVTVTLVDDSIWPVIEDGIDEIVSIYSVNKIAVAAAVWDKIERGELALDQKLDLPADLIESSEGFYYLQTVYGDQLTLANIMTAMLLVSDNTAVRMCGRVCSGTEINEFLERKGFAHTRVSPLPDNPNRFYLGTSTPRETQRLLRMLAGGDLVSDRASDFILGVMLGVSGYHDGIRHDMSSQERARIATKFGAFSDGRHEAGIIFDENAAPLLVYVLCAKGQADEDNFGHTHPAVRARSELGRAMYDAVAPYGPRPGGTKRTALMRAPYRGSNGG